MNKIILVALGFLFGPQDILGQKGPLEYINVRQSHLLNTVRTNFKCLNCQSTNKKQNMKKKGETRGSLGGVGGNN